MMYNTFNARGEITAMKICRICGVKADTPAEIRAKFHKDSSKAYGYANICKHCKNLESAKYRDLADSK